LTNRQRIGLGLIAIILFGLWFFLKGNFIAEQEVPRIENESSLPAQNGQLNKEEEKKPAALDDTYSPRTGKMGLSSRPRQLINDDPVNLDGSSYSIKREKKKEIPITPGVAYQPGKGINVKIPGVEEPLLIQRDKVVWEKKF
jgi:hypothetical protein